MEPKPSLSDTVQQMIDTYRRLSRTDPAGSWTGVPADKEAYPSQDADDL